MSPADPNEIGGFAELVREHQAGLRAFLRSLGVEPDWVDDFAQEAFIIAFQKRAIFEPGKDFWSLVTRDRPAFRRQRTPQGSTSRAVVG